MAVKLNGAGRAHARQLIEAGSVDHDSPWTITPADEDALLGDPPDWTKYGSWHLGVDDEADRETKAAWRYPFGKDGKVYHSALRAIATRAAQQNETEIGEAASAMLEDLNKMMEDRVKDIIDSAPKTKTAGVRAWFQIAAMEHDEECADIHMYDVIGSWFDGLTAKQFIEALSGLPASVSKIRLHVNSPGGDVFEALAIANALRGHRAAVETTVEGLAASAATIVTQGGSDKVTMADNALMMVHNPYAMAMGTAEEMRRMAKALDRATDAIVATYARKSKVDEKRMRKMMDDETWMTADEAIAVGFADEKSDGLAAAASVDPRLPLNVPSQFAARFAPQGTIRKEGDEYCLYTEDGSRKLGCHPTREEAEEQERVIKRREAEDSAPVPVPAPAPAAAPPKVEAAAVIALCAEAGLESRFALYLVENCATESDVAARIASEVEARAAKRAATDGAAAAEKAREDGIRAVCTKFKSENLAPVLIRSGATLADAATLVGEVKAMTDRVEIETGILPGSGNSGARRKPAIDYKDVYSRLNKAAQ